ncbi:MAG: hypothetical protein R3Y30_17690, partial [Vibrio sp.]
ISHAVYLSVNRSGENTSTDYTATPSSFHTPEIIIAPNWIGEQFKCLAYTVEMPFKDHISHADELYGWSPERSVAFGHDMLAAVWATVDEL